MRSKARGSTSEHAARLAFTSLRSLSICYGSTHNQRDATIQFFRHFSLHPSCRIQRLDESSVTENDAFENDAKLENSPQLSPQFDFEHVCLCSSADERLRPVNRCSTDNSGQVSHQIHTTLAKKHHISSPVLKYGISLWSGHRPELKALQVPKVTGTALTDWNSSSLSLELIKETNKQPLSII